MSNKRASVRTEPWIPVFIQGHRELLSLEDVLLKAHLIRDLAVRDDLERSAILRFLTAMTVVVARQQKFFAQQRKPHGRSLTAAETAVVVAARAARAALPVAAATEGFDAVEVRAVLDRFDDQLYLVHPEHPFMQDPQAEVGTAKPIRALHPKTAGESAQEWFVMREMRDKPLNVVEAITALVTYYFHAPRAASGGVSIEVAAGRTLKFPRTQGGIAGRPYRTHPDMQIWWHGPNLAATLLLNIKPMWVDGDKTLPGWFEKPSVVRLPGSLSEWTHTGATALLVPELDGNGDIVFPEVHICGIILVAEALDPKAYKEAAKAQVARTIAADPRRVYADVKKKDGTTFRVAVSGITPANTTVQNLAAWWVRKDRPKLQRGILPLDQSGIAADLDVFVIDVDETMGSASIKGAGWTTIDRGVTGDTAADTEILRTLAISASLNVEAAIGRAARHMFPRSSLRPGSPTAGELSLIIESTNQFYTAARDLLEEAAQLAFAGTAIPDELACSWWQIALDAFDDATAPLISLAMTPRIAVARGELLKMLYSVHTTTEDEAA